MYRTALPRGRLAGSIAALHLRETGERLHEEMPQEALVLASLVVDKALELGSDRLDFRFDIEGGVHIEEHDEGRGLWMLINGHAPMWWPPWMP